MFWLRCGAMLFITAIAALAQESSPTPVPTPPTAATPITNENESEVNLIHLGDLIDVDVLGSLTYDWRGSLTPEGFLPGPEALPDRVFALCRSEEAVASEIAAGLTFLRDPKVVVRIVDRSNRPLTTLFGAVRTPQRFQIKRSVKLNELIVVAGGFTDRASGEIEIFRPASLSCGGMSAIPTPAEDQGRNRFVAIRSESGSLFINVKIQEMLAGRADANPVILAGDIVTVLESRPIYVIGGVANPRQIATRAQMTVSRAVAGAGGVSRDADPTKVTIFRRSTGDTAIIETDLEKIRAGTAEDILLQPYDIVEVAARGSSKRAYPPVVNVDDGPPVDAAKLPLRVIE